MAAELVGGAFLGAAVGELLKVVIDVMKLTVVFKSNFERLESTMKAIVPIVKEIEEYKRALDRSEDEIKGLVEILKNGEILVRKCGTVTWWRKVHKRPSYSKKLNELDESLIRFFNLNMQAQLVRDANEILVEMKKMNLKIDIKGGRNGGIHQQPNGYLGSCGVPGAPDFTVGLDVPLKELKMMMFHKDGDPMIVLSAPGGCGKTTLAKKLCEDREIKGKYKENILFVTVSKTPDLKVIIQRLIEQKGSVPDFLNDEDAMHHLEQLVKRLGPGPVLLVLDDVWSGSESLLEKFLFHIPDYKILITSRFRFPRFDSTYELGILNDEDAMKLFRYSAFPQDGSAYTPDEDLVKKIMRSCKGFPLALNVVGRSLYGQPIVAWKRRELESSKGQSIFSSDNVLLDCLQTSLNALDDMSIVRECFLDFALFPEDERTRAAALIDMWVESYDLDEEGVYAISYLHELSARNLVNLVITRKDASDTDSCYDGHFVTQHDILRELAIHQSSKGGLLEERERLIIEITGNNFPKWCLELNQKPIRARLLSISTDENFTSSWCDMQLPEVEVLILNFRTKYYTLPRFIEKMEKLKILIITNYGFCPAELTNIAVLGSLSNLKRIRFEHVSIPSLSEIKFKNLLKVSFVMCNISQAFQNCNDQIPNMFPKLTEIDIDYCNDLKELPAGLCDLVQLKKLSITNCDDKLSELPPKIGNLVDLEVLRLQSCTGLLELPDSFGSLRKLRFLDISDCLSLNNLPERMGELYNLQKLQMLGCSELSESELPQSIKNLEGLKEVVCDEETACRWKTFKSHLTNLKLTVPEENVNLNWLHQKRV